MTKETNEEKKFLYGMLASMFCWGISWPVGKILASYGAAESIATLRFIITFISLLVILVLIKEKLKISTKGIPALLAACVCMTAYSYLFLEGLHHGKAGAGGVLVTTLNPIITYLLAILISLRKPSTKEILGLFTGLIAGIFLLKLWQADSSILESGNLYFVGATLAWATLTRFTSISSRYGSPLSFSLWMYLICSFMMLPFVQYESIAHTVTHADSMFSASLFFSATITTSIATTYYFYATTKIGADKASGFIFLVPFSASIGSWLILEEIPLWNTLVGGILGITAVYILNQKRK